MNPSDPPRAKHPVRRALALLAGAALILVALVAALPTLFSTGFARRAVITRVNAATGGTLAIDHWSFGWFTGARIDGLAFDDAGGRSVRVKAIRTSKGVLGLLGRTRTLGDVVLDSPEVSLVVAAEPALEPASTGVVASAATPPPSAAAPAAGEPAGTVRLPLDLAGSLTVRQGRVAVRLPANGTAYEWRDLNASLSIESLSRPIRFDVAFVQSPGTGTLHLAGSVRLFEAGVFVPSRLEADASGEISALDLAPFAALAAGAGRMPALEGTLDARFSVKASGAGSSSAEGFVRLTGLVASGGVLTTDRLSIDRGDIVFDVVRAGSRLDVRALTVEAPFLSVKTSGTLSDLGTPRPAGAVHSGVTVDLAGLARQLPATLRLGKGVVISRGTLTATADVAAKEGRLACALQAGLADLEGTRDGQTLRLESPVSLKADLTLGEAGTSVDRFTVASAFGNVSGSGDARDFQVSLKADLAAVTREAAKFADLGGVKAAGLLEAEVRVRGGSNPVRDVEATLVAAPLTIAGMTPDPLVLSRVKATARCRIANDAPGALDALRMTVETDGASLEAVAAQVRPGTPWTVSEVRGASLKARLNLASLLALARRAGAVAAGPAIQGEVVASLQAALAGGVAGPAPITLTASGLSVVPGPGKSFTESNATFSAVARCDFTRRLIEVTDAQLAWSSGALVVPLTRVTDWNRAPLEITSKAAVTVNVERLVTQLAGFINLRPGAAIAGGIAADMTLAAGEGIRTLRLDSISRGLAFTTPAGVVLAEPGLKLVVQADQEPGSGDVVVKQLQFGSSAFELAATGTVARLATSRDLGLDGLLTCDFARISELTALLTGVRVAMEGRRPQPFFLRMPLAGREPGDTLRQLKAGAGIYLAQCAAFGIRVTNTEFGVTADKGFVQADVRARVNEGVLRLLPTIDAGAAVPVLTFPPESMVLRDARVTAEMMDGLVAGVHPVLKGCGITSGSVDLLLRRCRVPLDASWTNAATVQGELALKGVVLAAGGVVGSILELAGQPEARLTLSNQVVAFTCVDGRLETSPLVLAGRDYGITITGHALMDGRLKYVAEFPLTEKMVGAKRYPYVKDVVLRVPIEGTVAKPVISTAAFKAALAEAAGKVATEVLIDQGTKALEKWLQKSKSK